MDPAKKQDETNPLEEVSLSTPFGKLITKGNGAIAIITLCVCVGILYFVLRTSDTIADERTMTAQRYGELSRSMKAQVQAQTLMTCIISLPEARREEEYRQANSFCRRMSTP